MHGQTHTVEAHVGDVFDVAPGDEARSPVGVERFNLSQALPFLEVLLLHLPLGGGAAFASLGMHHVILLQKPVAEAYPAKNHWVPCAGLHDVWPVGGQPTVGALGDGGQGQNGKGSHGFNMGDFGVRVECSSQIRPHRGLFRAVIENDSHLRYHSPLPPENPPCFSTFLLLPC